MKKDWERSVQIIPLSQEKISELIQPLYPDNKIEEFTLLDGGLVNTNYKIKLFNHVEPIVLRIYAKEAKYCVKEVKIIDRVSKFIPVPQIKFVCTENIVISNPYAIMKYVEGVRLSQFLEKETNADLFQVARDIGIIIANLFKIKFNKPGFFNSDLSIEKELIINEKTYPVIINEFIENLAGERVHDNIKKELLQLIEKNVNLLSNIISTPSLVHGDFNPLNIIVNEVNGMIRVNALLDWEYAFSGHSLFDIANFMRYDQYLDDKFVNTIMRTYVKNGGYLPKQWLKIAKLLDVITLLSMLDRSAIDKNTIEDINDLFQKTIRNWENL